MISGFLLSLAIQALLTLLVLRWLAKDEADLDFGKMLLVMAGLTLINAVLSYVLRPYIGLLYLLVQLALTAYALKAFCWVSWPRAWLCAGVLGALNLALVFGMVFALAWCTRSSEPTVMDRHDKNVMEAAAMLNEECEASADTLQSETNVPIAASATAQVARLTAATEQAAIGAAESDTAADWIGARRKVHVGGIGSSGKNRFVMINGAIYNAGSGDTVTISHNGSNFTWLVVWQTNQVVLQPQQVALPPHPERK